jgi:CTP-dependent riboflavin kinase
LWQGTINIKIPDNTEECIIIPSVKKEGCDQFDVEENQYFLIRSCKLKGVMGHQILPMCKATGKPRGRHAEKVIEIALKKEIEIKDGDELEVELEGFDN